MIRLPAGREIVQKGRKGAIDCNCIKKRIVGEGGETIMAVLLVLLLSVRPDEKQEGRTKNGRRSRSLPPAETRRKREREKERKKERKNERTNEKRKKRNRGSDRSQSDLPLGKYYSSSSALLCLLYSRSR